MTEGNTMFMRQGNPQPDEAIRNMMGPSGLDQMIRQAITQCWRMLPEQDRTPEKVEQEFLRVANRALKDFKEDMTAFGFAPKGT